jgi:hypothetical protein
MQMRTINARRILITLAACVALLAIPALASANKNLRTGFLDNSYAASDPAAFWADAVELNVGFMRWDLQWVHMAATKPTNARNVEDPAYFWGATDNFVRQAAEHGLQDRIMFTLWSTPKWASSLKKSGSTADMPKIRDWRAFVHVVATRYSGKYTPPGATTPLPRVVSFETWNEPNAWFALRPQIVKRKAVSPRNYVKLLNALKYEVRRAVSFKPTFVAGALYKQGGGRSVTPINFLRGMAAAKAKFDVLSIHPYNNTPRLGLKDGRDQSKTNPRFIGIGNFQTFITLSNQIFGKKYPIWVTEFGWQTPSSGKNQYVATVKQQARFARQSVLRFRQLPQVARAAWFLLRDDPPGNGTYYTTGLRYTDGTKKPSFNAWKSAAKRLRHSPVR